MRKSLFIILLILFSCKKTDAIITIDYDDLQISDVNAKNNFIKGLKEIENENFENAKFHFEKSNQIEQNNVIIINGLANTINILGDTEKAELLFRKSLRIDSSFISTYENFGNFLNEQRRFFEAEKILMLGLKKNLPENYKIGIYLNLALIMKKQHRCQEALKYAELASKGCQDFNIYRTDIIEYIEDMKNCN